VTELLLGDEKPPELGQRQMWSPLVASIYETPIWTIKGRPDFSVEYSLARKWLAPALTNGGTLLDLSCGPARMGRQLRRSPLFQRVIGLDFSEAMLDEAVKKKTAESIDGFPLVRGDVRNLPIADNSIAAVYAGAAPHIWPKPVFDAFKEVARVLSPGGVFVSSTFTQFADIPVIAEIEKQFFSSLSVFSPQELRNLAESAGLVDFEIRSFPLGYSIFRAVKYQKGD